MYCTGVSEPRSGGGQGGLKPAHFSHWGGGNAPTPLYTCLYFSRIMYVWINDINQDKYLLQLQLSLVRSQEFLIQERTFKIFSIENIIACTSKTFVLNMHDF